MSEEKNIPDEKSEDQKSSPAGRAGKSERVTAALEDSSIQHSASNIQHVKEMEVHKHPHHVTHKKNWPEYLLEFLMLFLAVFLGFIAENIRENGVNREIEKNNIKSFIRNLQEDSVRLVESIDVNEKRFRYLDSLIFSKTSSATDDIFQKRFIFYMLKLGYLDYFASNESTFKQMQSSGTLRLIKSSNTLDSILNYETHYERIKHQEDICSAWWNKAIEQVSSIVDLTPLAHLAPNTLWDITLADLDNIQLPKVSKDLSNLQSYYNWRINERISLGYYIQDLHGQLSNVRMLIPYLEKEYHLKNE